MAKKDWKLIGHKLGMKHDISSWWNQDKKLSISTRKDWNNVIIERGSIKILEKNFIYKYQKIKFIKAYMRKH